MTSVVCSWGGQRISAFCIQLQNTGEARTSTYCVDVLSEDLKKAVGLIARNDEIAGV